MKTFEVEIKESLSKMVKVKANTIEEALLKTREKYEKQEIVLDSEDFITTEIEEYKDERP